MVSIGEGICVCSRWVLSGVTCMFVNVFMRVYMSPWMCSSLRMALESFADSEIEES